MAKKEWEIVNVHTNKVIFVKPYEPQHEADMLTYLYTGF